MLEEPDIWYAAALLGAIWFAAVFLVLWFIAEDAQKRRRRK